MSDQETLNLEEAAALARLGVESMRDLIDAGEVPAVRLNQKHTVLLREDVIDFIRTKARQQAEERRRARQDKPGRRRRTPKADLGQFGSP